MRWRVLLFMAAVLLRRQRRRHFIRGEVRIFIIRHRVNRRA